MSNLKLISTILVLILIISSFSSSYGVVEKLEFQENIQPSMQKIVSPTSSFITMLNLDESLERIQNQEVVVTFNKKPTITRVLILQEIMVLSNTKDDGIFILLLKQDNNQAILQRIFNDKKDLLNDIDLVLHDDTGIQ